MRHAAVLAVAFLCALTASASGAAARSPHLSLAGWAAYSTYVTRSASLGNAQSGAAIDAKVCDVLPPPHGDAQAMTVGRICRGSARFVDAFHETAEGDRDIGAAALIQDTEQLESLNRALASRLSGRCRGVFRNAADYQHAVKVATVRLARDLRHTEDRDGALARWSKRMNQAAMAVARESPADRTLLRACRPPT